MTDDASAHQEWRLYHHSTPLQPGEVVYVRPESGIRGIRGIIKPSSSSQEEESSKYLTMQCLDGNATEKRVKRKRLLPVYHHHHDYKNTSPSSSSSPATATTILITGKTIYYRHLAASQTHDKDRVLELGCSTGEASQILWRHAASWVGLDTGATMVETTVQKMNKYNCNIQRACILLDALKHPMQAKKDANQFGPVSMAFIDIGGNRRMDEVLIILNWVLTGLMSPNLRMVVIKSEHMEQALGPWCDTHGMIASGSTWFQERLRHARLKTIPKHPLQAPMVMSPLDDSLPICRYHNYHELGCAKNVPSNSCPFDHMHCHLCLQTGHIARECSGI
jgi:hypothetical protein